MIYFYSFNNNGTRALSQAFSSTSEMVNFMQSRIYDVPRHVVNCDVRFYVEDDTVIQIPTAHIVGMM